MQEACKNKTAGATTKPATQSTRKRDSRTVALAFAVADYRWRLLSSDRRTWTEPEGMRALTAAFLKYHSAKLALEELADDLETPTSISARISKLAA